MSWSTCGVVWSPRSSSSASPRCFSTLTCGALFPRSSGILSARRSTRMRRSWGLTRWCHQQQGQIRLPDGSWASCDRGAEQGDPLGPVYCALALLRVAREAREAVEATGAWCWDAWYMDDGQVCVPLRAAGAYVHAFDSALKRVGGARVAGGVLELSPSVRSARSPTGGTPRLVGRAARILQNSRQPASRQGPRGRHRSRRRARTVPGGDHSGRADLLGVAGHRRPGSRARLAAHVRQHVQGGPPSPGGGGRVIRGGARRFRRPD